MKPRQKGKAIILKSAFYRDADIIFEIFCQQHGRFSVLAKGIRKANARLSGAMRNFSIISYEILPSETEGKFPLLVGAKSEKFFAHENPSFLVSASLLAEISLVFLPQNLVHHKIFDLWEEFLYQNISSSILIFSFLCRFFSLLGLFPSFQHCANTKKKLKASDNIFWDFSHGIMTTQCSGKKCSFESIKLFAFCSVHPFSVTQHICPNAEQKNESWEIFWMFYKSHTPFFPRSKNLLKEGFLSLD